MTESRQNQEAERGRRVFRLLLLMCARRHGFSSCQVLAQHLRCIGSHDKIVPGEKENNSRLCGFLGDGMEKKSIWDVVIIGAGVSGCAAARELSRYELNICVLDKESDICQGTSKANSGVVHGGFDAESGTLKAKLNVLGNAMMDEMARKLDFEFKRNGSMVVCHSQEQRPVLEALLLKGRRNGVEGMEILSRSQALKREPGLADGVYAALYIPSGGIVCPFGMNIAYGENAAANGVSFQLETKVLGIDRRFSDRGYLYHIHTDKGDLETKFLINAAGVYADEIHNMVSSHKMRIIPRAGEYCLLDKSAKDIVHCTIFQLPTQKGKGVLVTPTVHGNLLLGPTATDIEDKEGTATTAQGIAEVMEKCAKSVKDIPKGQVITSFAGLRAHGFRVLEEQGIEGAADFIIEEVSDAPGFIDVACIESPGLTSAPAIGVYVRDILKGLTDLREKDSFLETRRGIPRFMDLSEEEKAKLLSENPAYGNVVCRCEGITEGEILEAVRRPLGATTLDGVKRRVRAGMGRCQGGFCTPKVMEILSRELGIPLKDIRKN